MNKIVIAFLLLSKVSIAQFYDSQKAVPSNFDKFIRKEAVEWAAYVNDTFRFQATNLSELLRKRFQANEIKVSLPDAINTYQPDNVHYATATDIKYRGEHPLPHYDSPGNVISPTKEADDLLLSAREFDSAVYNLLDISQLFYIANGKLLTYVPFVSPKMSVITSTGINLGQADYFVTGFNFDYRFTNSKKDRIITIGETSKLMQVDSLEKPFGSHVLKQLYGRNLAEALWPHVLSGELKTTGIANGKEMSLQELNELTNLNEKIEVPVYDSLGNLLRNQLMNSMQVSPSVFRQLEVHQSWYYNQTKNIVFNKITEIIFFQNNARNFTAENNLSPVFKIILQ